MSKRSCNPVYTNSCGNLNCAPGEQRKAEFIRAKAIKCNSFVQMKDYWLGSSKENERQKLPKRGKVPMCPCSSCSRMFMAQP